MENVDVQEQVQRLQEERNRVEGSAPVDASKAKKSNTEEIRSRLDEQFFVKMESEILNIPDEQAETDRPTAPDIVLQDREAKGKVKKEGWVDLGWSDREIEIVSDLLKKKLGLDGDAILNALEQFLGSGLTGREVLAKLQKEEELEGKVMERVQNNQYVQRGDDPDKWVKHYYFKELGLKEDNDIQRFILNKEFKEELSAEFLRERPRDLEELAWNISMSNQREFGVNGKFPVLKMQVDKRGMKKVKITENGEEKEVEVPNVVGRYTVNHANFLRWMYWQINEWYEIDTDEVTNYFEKVRIVKDQFTTIDLQTILYDHNTFFTDKQGKKHDELYKYIFLIPWMLMYIRTYDLEYQQAMGSGREELAKKVDQLFFLNKLTKKSFGKSMMYYLSTLPVDLDFKGTQSDTKLGAAWMKMYLAYYHFADIDGLKGVLGADNPFFTRQGMMDAIESVGKKKFGETGMPAIGTFLGSKMKFFEKAFDANGNVTTKENKENFMQFINFFGTGIRIPHDVTDVVKTALKTAISDTLVSNQGNSDKNKFKPGEIENTIDGYALDSQTLGVVDLIASSIVRFSGAAARADLPVLAAYDGAVPLYNTEAYRRKMATVSRGGSTGNIFTIPMFKKVVVDLFNGIPVETAEVEYTYFDEHGKQQKGKRRKTPFEVMMEMTQKYSEEEGKRIDLEKRIKADEQRLESLSGPQREALRHEIEALREEYRKFEDRERDVYKVIAEQISFDENTLRDYSKNHLANGAKLYEQVFGAHEIDFDKFTSYDNIFRGVSFNTAEFQKNVKENFLKPLRYLYSTYDSINMNMNVRAPVFRGRTGDTDHWEFEDMPLGKAIFGHQILDIPEFRMSSKVPKSEWEQGWKKRGKYIIDEEGKHVIDYNKVQGNKVLAYKQWALMKLGADLWTHITRHSTDPAYSMEHYMSVIEAIETIAGEVMGDETDMRGIRAVKPYFDHHQMQWLKRMSGTTTFKLFHRQLLSDLFIGDKRKKESLLGETANIFLSSIFKGY